MDKEKMLEWVNYGLERADEQLKFYRSTNDPFYWRVLGGKTTLETLKEQIEIGTFDTTK
jgi:hypothetical protein